MLGAPRASREPRSPIQRGEEEEAPQCSPQAQSRDAQPLTGQPALQGAPWRAAGEPWAVGPSAPWGGWEGKPESQLCWGSTTRREERVMVDVGKVQMGPGQWQFCALCHSHCCWGWSRGCPMCCPGSGGREEPGISWSQGKEQQNGPSAGQLRITVPKNSFKYRRKQKGQPLAPPLPKFQHRDGRKP